MDTTGGTCAPATRERAGGGPREFDASFTADMPRLRRRLMALTGNPHDADDLVQETYLRLSRRAHAQGLGEQRHPYAYTCTVALNLLRDSWQHPSRRERATDRLPETGWDGGLGRYEANATALALLGMLSPKEAAAVILVDLEGLSHDSAGERLGAHRGTVQRNRMRALAKMRAALTAQTPVPRPDGGGARHRQGNTTAPAVAAHTPPTAVTGLAGDGPSTNEGCAP
ncbi:RNA polymerase sigma factor [Streptomyces sp. NPDC014846]|uniref:RNA polymerase sigma factor n=1 Tax=Streptomyces sp. NPDC014846 TaxID=3364922 RepID=UPI0036F777A9